MGCDVRQHCDVVWIDLFGRHTCAQHWLVADLFGQRPLPCKVLTASVNNVQRKK